jgi:hypothetical protein
MTNVDAVISTTGRGRVGPSAANDVRCTGSLRREQIADFAQIHKQ